MPNKFFIYSLPHSNEFQAIHDNGKAGYSIEMHGFNGHPKFIFTSDSLQKYTKEDLLHLDINPFLSDPVLHENYITQDNYLYRIEELKKKMKNSEVEKVVFSRIIPQSGTVNLIETFLKLQAKNPHSFCYLMHHDEVDTWIGATPEILLKETPKSYETMSLAGTLPINVPWSDKEYQEQKMVTDYIANILVNDGISFEISPMEDEKQGAFKHLKQKITIEKGNISYSSLLKQLNPTPAVCGLPKNKALHLIHQMELHDRELYSGFIRINNDSDNTAFVNIRCAKIFKDYVDMYVGGGITQQSDPDKEWQETEAKSSVIKNALVLY